MAFSFGCVVKIKKKENLNFTGTVESCYVDTMHPMLIAFYRVVANPLETCSIAIRLKYGMIFAVLAA